jgi:spore coat polysaccharide biosynthesis protein SpsF
MKGRTDQEIFWAGEFGSQYTNRNDHRDLVAANTSLFAQALRGIPLDSVLEIGANIGQNLLALRTLYPEIQTSAVEINELAARRLVERVPGVQVEISSIDESQLKGQFDLVLSKGVLIHLTPDSLQETYRRISRWSSRFVLFAEYYNPTPIEISYRGHEDKLFKRDFAGEFLAVNQEFRLRDYGFIYRGDQAHPLDDTTWFLMERPR